MCKLTSRSSLRARRAVFTGCTGIPFIPLGALDIPRKSLVAASAGCMLEARTYEIHLAVPFCAGGDNAACCKCIGAEGEHEKKGDYD